MISLAFIICAVAGYLLGSINASIILSHLKGTDIRKYGSGNAGATNTLRTFGKGAAVVVLLVDVLKGVAAVLIARYVFPDAPVCQYICGFGAILGHNFPLYFGFKGGKGVLTSVAVLTALNWWVGLIALVVALVIMAITKYVSLGSMLGAITAPIIAFFLKDIYFIVFTVCAAGLIVIRHKDNIVRLVNGNERKLGEKKNEQ